MVVMRLWIGILVLISAIAIVEGLFRYPSSMSSNELALIKLDQTNNGIKQLDQTYFDRFFSKLGYGSVPLQFKTKLRDEFLNFATRFLQSIHNADPRPTKTQMKRLFHDVLIPVFLTRRLATYMDRKRFDAWGG